MAKKFGFNTKLRKPQEPRWNKGIKDKINSLRKDLRRLDQWSKDELQKEEPKDWI